jgi:hypothetical protein
MHEYGIVTSADLRIAIRDGKPTLGHCISYEMNNKNPSPEILLQCYELMCEVYRAEGAVRPLTFDYSTGVIRIVPNRPITSKMKPHPSLKPVPFKF